MTGAPFGATTVNLDAGYTYDDEGHVASVQYPVSQWNASMGRLNTMADQNSNTLVSGVSYGPANQLLQLNANTFTETRTYNANLQLIELLSGTSIHYKYNYSPNQNNGRIQSQNDVISGETITYQYDALNRLIQASGTADPGGAWNQNFAYDGFANLLQKTASYAPANLYLGTDPLSNRLNTGGAIYDSNGNLTGNGNGIYAQVYAYDVSNRLKATTYATGAQTIYGYDHSNQRVYKASYDASNNSFSNEEIAFYGIDGKKLSVWSLSLSGGSLNLTTTATNQWFDGRLVKSQDQLSSIGKYYPYGEDRGSSNAANGQEKFATYTRDADSALDYASQRYYSAPLGRFMTVDPSNLNVDDSNPGSWNMYSYLNNDPENSIDPTGLAGGGSVTVYGSWDRVAMAMTRFTYSVYNPAGGYAAFGLARQRERQQQQQEQMWRPPQSNRVDCSRPPSVPQAPPGSSLSSNMVTATTLNAMGGTTTWIALEAPYSMWDYKSHYGAQYTAFGNFNYGATCNAMGLNLTACQRGAGAAAFASAGFNVVTGGRWTAGPGNPVGSPAVVSGVPTYGDQTRWNENPTVIAGYQYAEWQRVCH